LVNFVFALLLFAKRTQLYAIEQNVNSIMRISLTLWNINAIVPFCPMLLDVRKSIAFFHSYPASLVRPHNGSIKIEKGMELW